MQTNIQLTIGTLDCLFKIPDQDKFWYLHLREDYAAINYMFQRIFNGIGKCCCCKMEKGKG